MTVYTHARLNQSGKHRILYQLWRLAQIDRDVDVTLEYAPEVLQSYNKIKYDIDQSKYAKELQKYYSIAQMGVTLKAGSPIPTM